MDDLLGTDWNAAPPAAANNSNGPPRSSYSIPVSAMNPSRASPIPSPFANNLNAPKPTPKAPSPANDSFAGLLGANSGRGQGNLTLQERQKQLLQDKQRQEQEQKQRYAQQYGGGDFWDNLGSGKSTPKPPIQRNAVPQQNDDDDILAAFNSAAPVDKSSHFPPPSASAAASGRSTPAIPKANALLADEDDDPFGLGAGPRRQATPAQAPATSMNDDDDILGDLGKPVTAKPPRRETVDEAFATNDHRSPSPPRPTRNDPLDRPIAELVDMGFPADKSKRALQETGGDVQAAVGWLLNQAHQESRERSQAGGGSARASPAPQSQRDEPRRGREAPDSAMPAWMRQDSRPSSTQRRQDNSSPATERDVAAYASEFGTSLFKSANSLWKTGQKKMQKAVAEFQTEGDPSQPKWMRDASADRAPPQIARSSTPRSAAAQAAQAQAAADRTNEAMLLEAGDRVRPQQSRTPEIREHISRPDSRVRSPAQQELPVRNTSQPRFMQQAASVQDKRPLGKLTRQDIEEQSTQNYISPARRKKTTPKPEPQPEPEVDLFSPAPVAAPASQPAPARSSPAPRPTTIKNSTPAPKPQAPTRTIPSISPSALSTSTSHRQAGTLAFKRGDYDAAHTSYTSALTPLPPSHPLVILVMTNRSLTALKTGDPKLAISDADRALTLIGPSLGENERIDLGNGEGEKDMKEFYGKALMRKAEALEHMEKWGDAANIWRTAVSNGVGGAIALRARDRCEKAAGTSSSSPAVKPAPTRQTTTKTTKAPAGKPIPPQRPAVATLQSGEAVRKLREQNAAADAADDEKFALTDTVTARVDGWKAGKTDNLRALLGSLDTVLWEGSGWKKVGMSELILANKVKIVYMRAISKVHPDKVPLTATTEQKMISGSVFSILNEAWDKFKNENGL